MSRDFLDPSALERNDRPLQHPGADVLLNEDHFPPRGHNLDVRYIIDRHALRQLLEAAEASVTGRVVVHGASLRVRTWRGGDGHTYSTFTFLGSGAVPEDPVIALPGRGENVDALGLLGRVMR